MKYFLILIGFTGAVLFGSHAYGLYVPESAEELLEQSQTIFVGNITSVNVLQFEKSSTYITEENGVEKQIIENYTLSLDEYTVNVEEFLKNHQNSNVMIVRQPTTSIPGRIVPFSGFEEGDRVLFYLEKINEENTYSPESFEIPKSCDTKSVLSKPRITFVNDFRITQNGIQKDDNFTAGIPMKFVYDIDTRTLEGKRYDFDVGISRVIDKNNVESVLKKKIHAETKPCEWIASASWEITPTEGEHTMGIHISEEDGGSTGLSTHFFVIQNMPLENIAPPLKQLRAGISFDKIECKEDLVLIYKYDDSPACVKPETKQKLIERGWIEDIYNKDQNPSLSENSIESYKKKYDIVIEGKVLWSIGHKGYPVRIQYDIEPIKIHKAHPALSENTISFVGEKDTATEIGKIAVFGLDYDEKDNYFRLVDRFVLDSSNIESEPSTVIEISFGKPMTRNFLPVVFSEITTNAESLDKIKVWKFELIGHPGDDRRVVWDTVPKDTGIFYEINDDSGQDIIDHTRMPENWAISADQHVYNMDCGVFHTVTGESAHPSSFPIKNNTHTIITENSWMGIYPNSDGEYSFEFASIFETSVKLPEGAKIISQESKQCKLTHNIEDDPEGKYTDGYYTKMVFRLE